MQKNAKLENEQINIRSYEYIPTLPSHLEASQAIAIHMEQVEETPCSKNITTK